MNKIEHIGIAVSGMSNANKLFALLLGKEHYKTEMVESEHVSTSFFQVGETKIELLQASSSESTIARFIEKKGEAVHHIAFSVEDIFTEIKRLKEAGFRFISEEPKQGADNKLICFLHPKTTNGILVELCQEIKKVPFIL